MPGGFSSGHMAVWQPQDGAIDGALQLDGIDDYVSTPFVLDPAHGDFTVSAWIKGGAAGQVIISQERGVNWLMADLANGTLRTDLRVPEKIGRGATPAGPPLVGSTVVADDNWHQIGFVRMGGERILYVDGSEVARDTAEILTSLRSRRALP